MGFEEEWVGSQKSCGSISVTSCVVKHPNIFLLLDQKRQFNLTDSRRWQMITENITRGVLSHQRKESIQSYEFLDYLHTKYYPFLIADPIQNCCSGGFSTHLLTWCTLVTQAYPIMLLSLSGGLHQISQSFSSFYISFC